ncbi:hypothetical protein ACS0TY_027080 [Phlomoides rotata]
MKSAAEIGDPEEQEAYHLLWSCAAPSRIKAIAWKVMKMRLPTKIELKNRGILTDPQDALCTCCGLEDEFVSHLFFECSFARKIWYAIYNWFGFFTVSHSDPKRHLLGHSSIMGSAVEIAVAIWAATEEMIWKTRNEVVFEKGKLNPMKSFGEIKAKIWSWFVLNGNRKVDGSFLDWSKNPRGCVS